MQNLLLGAGLAVLLVGASAGQHVLPGDNARVPAVGGSRFCAIARGGPGYLVVWEDTRTSMAGWSAQQPRMGNQMDIYGLRLDLAGQPIDAEPIVITNMGRSQREPRLAWNGQAWLVVFTTERPDWYFFDDIVGVRVDGNGAVLDPSPISIRPELATPSNYYGANPSVSTDGSNWVVVWEDYNPANGHPNVRGTRIAPGGQVLDPNWVTLYEYGFPSFGPREPQLSFANGSYLLVWRDAASALVQGRRISTTLQPLAAPFQVANYGAVLRPSLASDGNQHYLIVMDRLFRIGSTGTVLDPNGITVAAMGLGQDQTVNCCWNGSSLSVVQTRNLPSGVDVWLSRVAASGLLLDATPLRVTTHTDNENQAFVAGDGGESQVVFAAIAPNLQHFEDVRSVHVDAAGAASPHVDVDAGLARQERVHAIATPGGHLLTFVSRSSLGSRFLAQRLDAAGNAIDAAPVEIAAWSADLDRRTASACDGTVVMFAWTDFAGTGFIRRYSLDLQPLDAQPVQVFTGAPGSLSVAAGNGQFLVVGVFRVTNDTNNLRGVRVRAADSAVLDAAPFFIGGNWINEANVAAFGGGYLVHWTHAATHDTAVTTIEAAVVMTSGPATAPFTVSTTYYASGADLATNGAEALLVYQTGVHGEDGIRARRIGAGGAMPGPEIVVCDAAVGQMFPSVSTFGDDYVVAWTDFRSNAGIEQPRGDVYLGRVRHDGVVLDPNGIALTSGPLPEDDVDLTTNGGVFACYSAFDRGGAPHHVQRIVVERIEDRLPTDWRTIGEGTNGINGAPVLAGFGDLSGGNGLRLELTGAAPLTIGILCIGLSRIDAPFLGGVLVPFPDLIGSVATDAVGRFDLGVIWPAGLPAGLNLWHQAWLLDVGGLNGVVATNGLVSTSR